MLKTNATCLLSATPGFTLWVLPFTFGHMADSQDSVMLNCAGLQIRRKLKANAGVYKDDGLFRRSREPHHEGPCIPGIDRSGM